MITTFEPGAQVTLSDDVTTTESALAALLDSGGSIDLNGHVVRVMRPAGRSGETLCTLLMEWSPEKRLPAPRVLQPAGASLEIPQTPLAVPWVGTGK